MDPCDQLGGRLMSGVSELLCGFLVLLQHGSQVGGSERHPHLSDIRHRLVYWHPILDVRDQAHTEKA